MAQFGKYFEFNGHKSNEPDLNLMLASFEQIDSYATGMEREVQRGDMNRYRYKPNHFGATYNAPLEFEVTFIKDICNGADMAFTRSEYRKIVDWLTEPEYPSLYHMTDYEEDWADEEEDYFGVFSNVQNHAYGEVIGITATFTCDSPFAWSPERVWVYRSENAGINPYEDRNDGISHYIADDESNLIIYDDNVDQILNIDADTEYTYPKIIIHPHEAGDVSIDNRNEDRGITMHMNSENDTIYIDTEKLTITNYIGKDVYLSDLGITDPVNVYWPRLFKGENALRFMGNATIILIYREARKVGAY